MRARAVLGKIDALPGPEVDRAVPYRNVQRYACQHRFHMGRHVVRTFCIVNPPGIGRRKALQRGAEVRSLRAYPGDGRLARRILVQPEGDAPIGEHPIWVRPSIRRQRMCESQPFIELDGAADVRRLQGELVETTERSAHVAGASRAAPAGRKPIST